MTAVGAVRLERWHSTCPGCAEVGFVADDRLGLTGYLTTRARRMACLAGLNDPFRKAQRLLGELSGWSVDAETLRRLTHAEADHAARTRTQRHDLPEAFAAASGDHEVHIDAGKVNTPGGWRDVKVAAFAVRERASSSSSEDYEQRDLPAPQVRSVIAAIEEVGAFGPRCRAEAERLPTTDWSRLSVLGDGAEWVWNLAGSQFPDAKQVLDFYHASEYLAKAGRASLGSEALSDWLEDAKKRLAGDGYAGACEALSQLPGGAGEIGEALNYLAGHRERVNYALRLCRGQTIGSGLVEGTIKQRVNLRLKRTGARWLAAGVGPFVEMLAMSDTPEWAEYWTNLAA
jgi:hypothetical protein